MGRALKNKKRLTRELEKKIEKYFNDSQKLQMLWENILETIRLEGMNPEVFTSGKYMFLNDPIVVLDDLHNGEIESYDMFIAELEDIIEHYDAIEAPKKRRK